MKKQLLFVLAIVMLVINQFGVVGNCWGDIVTKNLTCMDDVFVNSVDPDENYNDGAPSCPNCSIALKLIPEGGHGGEARVLLKFWLADIPSDATIISARLRLRDLDGATNNSSDSVPFTIHRINSVWFESIATWNNQPLFDSNILASGTLSGTGYNASISIDADLVNDWLSGTIANNGIILVTTGFVSSTSRKTMPSYEFDGLGIYLEVTYDDLTSGGDSGGGDSSGSGSDGSSSSGGCFIASMNQ